MTHLRLVAASAVRQISVRSPATRTSAVLTCLMCSLFGASLGVATAAPNVVVFMADDLDAASVDRLLAEGMMPSLEQHLSQSGTSFTNSFVTTPWCCPSRATFFTGRYSHNHNVLTNSRPLGGVTRFDDSSTLATWLRDAGYRTGLIGKYLNGYGSDSTANSHLDDPAYVPPGWDDWQSIIHQEVFKLYDYQFNVNGAIVQFGSAEQDYQTDVLSARATAFIDEAEAINDTQPFFLLIGTLAPHLETHGPTLSGCTANTWNVTIRPAPRHQGTLPLDVQLPRPPSFNETDMQDKPVWLRARPTLTDNDISCLERQYRDRLESMLAVDDLVGAVVDALVRNDELDDTVLVFTSDNGFFFGEHRLSDKIQVYEESIRVPLLIRVPGIPGPQSSDGLVLNNDLAPTIADLAGVNPGQVVDGRSLIPLLHDPDTNQWRRQFLVEYRGDSQTSIRYGPREPYAAVRTGPLALVPNHVYVEYQDTTLSRELYDLTADPHQLSSEHQNPTFATANSELAALLALLRDCSGDGCAAAEDHRSSGGAAIGDRVWRDSDGDGIQDAGEHGLAGVSVELQDCSTTVLARTTTDSDGAYSFAGLNAGSYRIHFLLPSGFTFSPRFASSGGMDSDPHRDTGTTGCKSQRDGQIRLGIDAGMIPDETGNPPPGGNARLGDYVWQDLDGDGIQDGGEPGFAGLAVELLDCAGSTVATQTTDFDGAYLFDGLAPGSYRLKFSLPQGYGFSPRFRGPGGRDSDADTSSGLTGCKALGPGQSRLGLDAGMRSAGGSGSARIGDFVWKDSNRNGLQDPGEAGLPGATVALQSCGGSTLQTTVTDGAGQYLFTNLDAGRYRLQFTAPAGFSFSPRDAGPDGRDSDANAAGVTSCKPMGSGQNRLGRDAGLVLD